MKQTFACPSCGAKLTAGADRCDLCGTSMTEQSDLDELESGEIFTEELDSAEHLVVDQVAASIEPMVCATCEHVNPARSQFCNQCGTFLSSTAPPPGGTNPESGTSAEQQAAATTPPPFDERKEADRPPSDVGRRALLIIGVGILAVVVLYGLTVISNQGQPPAFQEGELATAEAQLGSAALPDSLQAMADALAVEGTAASWAQLGHLYFTAAMQSVEEAARPELAGLAVDAFDISLEIGENPDVRTSLAEAAQFDPRNPMRAVQELQAVLETTPNHIAANYLLGALRARIGRLEGAAESFQRVIDLTPANDPIHQRAVEDLATVRQTMATAPSGQ